MNVDYVLIVSNEYVKEHNSSVMRDNLQGNAQEYSFSSYLICVVLRNVQSGKENFKLFVVSVYIMQ